MKIGTNTMEQNMRRVGRTNIAMAFLLENTEFIIILLSKMWPGTFPDHILLGSIHRSKT